MLFNAKAVLRDVFARLLPHSLGRTPSHISTIDKEMEDVADNSAPS